MKSTIFLIFITLSIAYATLPVDIYSDPVLSPQNMDFDRDNNQFRAHSGWYKDLEVFYYKFRMFTPGFYPGTTSAEDVPMAPLFIMSVNNSFEGMIGNPVIHEYPIAGNVDYSDFVQIIWVTVFSNYTENSLTSSDEITSSGYDIQPSGIYANLPVVPVNSTLQRPGENTSAPIDPVTVWFNGTAAQAFIFEVSDESAADAFAWTRTEAGDAWSITVVSDLVTNNIVAAIPLIHLNQYWAGITPGVNNGGPSDMGSRNIIDLDRPDNGYSPLWQIWWITETPLDYSPDQRSSFADNAEVFEKFITPMFVNCPNVGDLGSTTNPEIREASDFTHEIEATVGEDKSWWIKGSHMTTIMTGGVNITVQDQDGNIIEQAQTNMMGAWEIEIWLSDLSVDVTSLDVIVSGVDDAVRTIDVSVSEIDGTEADDGTDVDPDTDADDESESEDTENTEDTDDHSEEDVSGYVIINVLLLVVLYFV